MLPERRSRSAFLAVRERRLGYTRASDAMTDPTVPSDAVAAPAPEGPQP
jgi:hypothetical protein